MKAENGKKFAYLCLILTPILWGSTFILTKNITQEFPIFWVQAIRHAIALFGFLPYLVKLRQINKKVLWVGFLTGGFNFLGMTAQTIGLQTATAGKAGFMTSLYVVFTPILSLIIFKDKPKKILWFSIFLTIIGLSILIFQFPFQISELLVISLGDMLLFTCAIFFALQIIFTDRHISHVDVYLLAFIQICTVSSLSFGTAVLFEPSFKFSTLIISQWDILLYLGICSTTLPFIFQNVGQKHVKSTETALIFSTEPLFATLFGIILGGETFSWQFVIGAFLFMSAIVIAIKSKEHKNLEIEN